MSRDTEDLEALFDRVAAETAVKVVATAQQSAAAAPAAAAALAAAAVVPAAAVAPAAATICDSGEAANGEEPPADVFHRIGVLTRGLHNALRELGYDKVVENAMHSLPDARDRLDYIATLTGKAAERALAAAEAGVEHQNKLSGGAEQLARDWDRAFDGALSLDEFKATAVATRAFLKDVPSATGATNAQLTEIMIAQDFHDLTGQMIQRIVKLARELEAQLVQLLLETTPPEMRPPTPEGFLSGPAMNVAGRTDVVTSQEQVDDLLDSLGF